MGERPINIDLLRKQLFRLLLIRLLIPMIILTLALVAGAGYFGENSIEEQQQQSAASLSQMAEKFLDQGARIMGTLTLTEEKSGGQAMQTYMESALNAYGYFETIYLVDSNYKVQYLVPYNRNYIGVDMSGVPDIRSKEGADGVAISRPYISLRTGDPTVLMVKKTADGNRLVGELNLGVLEQETLDAKMQSDQSMVLIMDPTGTALAHPDIAQVRMQGNLSNLPIFKSGLTKDVTEMYVNNGNAWLGSSMRIAPVNWVVVAQTPLTVLFLPYLELLVAALVTMMGIWAVVLISFQRKLSGSVVDPLYLRFSEENEGRLRADEANAAKSSYLASMTHELRTPLNAILGFSECMSTDPELPSDVRANLRIINRSGEHLLMLINDVLDLAKIEAGKIELKVREFDLFQLVENLQEMFRARTDKKGIEFRTERIGNLPQKICGDETKIRQILINLVGNGIKFTETGFVALSVEPVALDENGCRLRFVIRDTGPGIAPEELGLLFNEYVQAEYGKRSENGSGLGLSIARKYARIMGGDIQVSSQLNVGSEFTVEIVVAIVEDSESDSLIMRISKLDVGLLERLKEAASKLETEKVGACIEEIRVLDPEIADALAAQAEDFKYDEMYEWIMRATKM